MGIAGRRDVSAAFALDAESPAFLRKGALEALGAQLDFEKDVLSFTRHGATAPLKVNEMGRYISSVVEFGKWPPRSDRGPNLAASCSEWSFSEKRPNFTDAGPQLPFEENSLYKCCNSRIESREI